MGIRWRWLIGEVLFGVMGRVCFLIDFLVVLWMTEWGGDSGVLLGFFCFLGLLLFRFFYK